MKQIEIKVLHTGRYNTACKRMPLIQGGTIFKTSHEVGSKCESDQIRDSYIVSFEGKTVFIEKENAVIV